MDINLENELEIVWLQPRERYPYLREQILATNFRQKLPRRYLVGCRDANGYPRRHYVAYSVLKPDALSDYPGRFWRRFWFVMHYDRYEGHGFDHRGVFYKDSCPWEGVKTSSIIAGRPSERGWDDHPEMAEGAQ